jgi:hypothetical protein
MHACWCDDIDARGSWVVELALLALHITHTVCIGSSRVGAHHAGIKSMIKTRVDCEFRDCLALFLEDEKSIVVCGFVVPVHICGERQSQ